LADKYRVAGFKAATARAGLRGPGDHREDMALIYSDTPAVAAGVFTRNRVRAAPVKLCRKRLRSPSARAILVNAGVANAMTGRAGMEAATNTCDAVAEELGLLPSQVLPASTGVIGVRLPADKMIGKVPELVAGLSYGNFRNVAQAILTTDTVPKITKRSFKVGARRGTVLGIAKGAGMIAPDMATMLAFLFTDVAVRPRLLRNALGEAVKDTFNRIVVDGDTSTNDSVIVMAGGALGNEPLKESGPGSKSFIEALKDVCSGLAEMIVRDGEGAARVARITVKGAASESDAVKAAGTVAGSPLVKTALHGADPNWGRIAAAIGRSGAKMDERKLVIKIGAVTCVRCGVQAEGFSEKKAAAAMRKNTVDIEVDLGTGNCRASFLTCDMGPDYVRINSHYRT